MRIAMRHLLLTLLLISGQVHATDCEQKLSLKAEAHEWIMQNAHGTELLSPGQIDTVTTVIRPFLPRLRQHAKFHSIYEQLYEDKVFALRYPIISKSPQTLDITFFADDLLLTDCAAYNHLKDVRVCDLYTSAPDDTRLMSEVPAESSRGLLYVPPKYISPAQGLSYDYFTHEFAHLLHFNFMTLSEIKELERLYASAMKLNLPLDDYAASNESEYFAQGLEAYFASDDKDKIDYIYWDHTASELRTKDPALYAFIERLIFKAGN